MLRALAYKLSPYCKALQQLTNHYTPSMQLKQPFCTCCPEHICKTWHAGTHYCLCRSILLRTS